MHANYGLEFNMCRGWTPSAHIKFKLIINMHACVYVSMHACRYGVASFPGTPPLARAIIVTFELTLARKNVRASASSKVMQ